MVSVAYGQGRVQGDRMRGMQTMHSPTSSMLLMYTIFSKISNLFDSNKPCILSMHNRKCENKMHRNRNRIGYKILSKICVKIIQKALK